MFERSGRNSIGSARTNHLPSAPPPTARLSPPPPSPDGLTPTRKLLKDIIDGGGIMERSTEDDKTNYRSLVSIIK
jgi:hypothetical protein